MYIVCMYVWYGMYVSPDILTKSGYLWYAETKTFGTHWTRLFFCIKKDMLVSAESTAKVRVPISLNLNLCSVKPAQVTDTERNFCFKVISPIRSLLLQAESSRGKSVTNYSGTSLIQTRQKKLNPSIIQTQ
jgi:hypothetical protein